MAKIDSWDALKALRGEINRQSAAEPDRTVVAVGMATCGVAAGAKAVMDALRDELDKAGAGGVSLVSTGCYGFCYAEPMVEVKTPGAPGIKYGYVDGDIARQIVRRHIMEGDLLDSNIIGQEVQKP